MNASKTTRGFTSCRPADTWEEGLICGNGTIGINAFCRPHDEMIIFTHEKMFLPCGEPTLPALMGPRLNEIRNLIDRGQYAEASQLAFDISGQKGFMYPDPFVPAFDLSIKSNADTVNDYQRSVDFSTGQAAVQWAERTGWFKRRFFVSRPHGVAVMELTGPADQLNCSLTLGPRSPGNGVDEEKVKRSNERFKSHVGDVTFEATIDRLSYACRFTRAYPGSVQRLVGMTKVISDGRRAVTNDNELTVTGATRILLLTGILLAYGSDDDGETKLAATLDATPTAYDDLLKSHAARHGDLFNRVSLNLGGSDHDRPIEALLEDSTTSELNPSLVEKVFDAGRHNIISSTGEWPPALQGIWGGTYVPDWAGDFTHNGNVPSAIAAMLMGNTPELMASYVRYLEYLVPGMEANAMRMFGARGVVLPSRTSTHGYNNALAPSFPGGFWVAGAAWAAHYFYDYWLYTRDRDFLADHALPFMEKVELFFEDFLFEDPNGTYVFSPTQSPENRPSNSDSQASFNATMAVAAAKELLQNLIEGSEELGVNADRLPIWRRMLEKMPAYMLTDDGLIKEWLTPKLENNDRHRHSSHLYPLYDGLPEEIANSTRLKTAFKNTIRDKLDRHWRENSTGFMSFGIVQLGQAATSLGDGEMAYESLVHLVNRYWLNNLASMHNHKSLLNMDISGGLPAVIIKMLVASQLNRITLLPALPKAWPTGTLQGVLCRGNVEIKRLHWNHGHIEVTLLAGHDQNVELTTPFSIKKFSINGGGTNALDNDLLQVRLAGGQETSLILSI